MLSSKKYLMPLLAVVLLVAASCTNDGLDDGSGADVVLEIVSLDNPAITAQTSGEGGEGLCTLLVEDWTASVMAAPKNSLAVISPFNDLTLHTVTITYNWIDPGIVTPTREVGLGDATIPAAGAASVTFSPIAFDDLDSGTMQGHTANLVLVFDASTVEGTHLRDTVQRQLFVEVCAAP
jgi:hypothetical protein